ncbi:MAG: tetratricopeptide repeat protein [Deltaproteobacteria bacterium]|nr:tetratricopeptide repeat protein [Deltaproteobacteria bacterium]
MIRKESSFDKYSLIAAALVFFISAGVYLITLANGFVYDDHTQVLGNLWTTGVQYIPRIFTSSLWAYDNQASNTYRPMMHLILMAERHIFGLEPWGYHLVNVVLHSLNAVLVFMTAALILKETDQLPRVFPGGARVLPFKLDSKMTGRIPALFTGLLFALHPVNTEAVAWVSAVTELSFTCFLILSFYLYAKYAESKTKAALPYVLSLVFFAAALLSKETAIVLPAAILAYDLSKNGWTAVKGRWRGYLGFFLTASAYMAVRTFSVGGIIHHKQISLSGYELVINVFPLIFKYFQKLVYPSGLNALYELKYAHSASEPAVMAGMIILSAFLAAFILFRGNKVVSVSLAFMGLPLLPVLYIPALSTSAFADRYLYLPSIGFSLLLGYAIEGGLSYARKRGGYSCWRMFKNSTGPLCLVIITAPAVISTVYAAGTISRSMAWKDDLTLWADTVQKSPSSKYAHYNLALAYQNSGDIDNAVSEFKEALRFDPSYESAHYNLAWCYQSKNDNISAVLHYREALKINPGSADTHYNLGLIFKSEFLREDAAREFIEALRIEPDYKEASEMLKELSM